MRITYSIDKKSPLIGLGTRANRVELQEQQSQRVQKTDRDKMVAGPNRIELLLCGREIRHLNALIESTPDIREVRVEQIRRSIENGTYNVRAEQVADKILGGNLIDELF